MPSWLKTGLDSILGFAADSPGASTVTSLKRKACTSRDAMKSPRHDADVYRNAPYGVAGPAAPRRGRRWSLMTEAEIAADAELLEEVRSRQMKPIGLNQFPRTKKVVMESLFSSSESDDMTEDDYTSASPAYSPKSIPMPRQTTTAVKQIKPTIIGSQSATKPTLSKVNIAPTKANGAWKEGMTIEEKWQTKPNKMAHEIAKLRPEKVTKRALQASVKEPEYALRDIEIRDGMWQIMDQIEKLTERYFTGVCPQASIGQLPPEFFKQFTPESAKIIGCVASGGPGGVQDWHDLFLYEPKRRALVAAIIGNVLVEQVFHHIFFGGSQTNIDAMMDLQRKHRNEDGFHRNKHYATYIHSILNPTSSKSFTLPTNFANHTNHIVAVLHTHLNPISTLTSQDTNTLIPPLHSIVTQAGLLSLSMRLDARTAYHFDPVFKGDTFDGKRMECFNREDMAQRNPHTPDDESGLTAAEKRSRVKLFAEEKSRAKGDMPLVKITLMHGLTAFRIGGWETPISTSDVPVFEKQEYARQGIRSRKLTSGWVYCRWGKARRYGKNGKADDDPVVHGEEWKGGFREFGDVEGVVDWVGLEREEREEVVKRMMAEMGQKGTEVGKEVWKEREVRVMGKEKEMRVPSAAVEGKAKALNAAGGPKKFGGVSEMDVQVQLEAEARTVEGTSDSKSGSASESESVSSMEFEP
ncbi:hypothetical protein BKA63DRAFT_464396 [Paraphoma chrysanthemicola]|nr:hypothetical protein BKA63DRAFT_464396 [Paraphoma chrysanthemicola]